jgi:hypothetical protein
MNHWLSLFIFTSVFVSGLFAEEAPYVTSTNQATQVTSKVYMIPESKLDPLVAKEAGKLADSAYLAMRKSIQVANQIQMEPVRPQHLIDGSSLVGAAILPDGQISFATQNVPGIPVQDHASRLAWALWFSTHYSSKQSLDFTLLPKNPQNFSDGNNAWYSPDSALAPFPVGKAMFDADMELKFYSLGKRIDDKGKFQVFKDTAQSYRNLLQIESDLYKKNIPIEDQAKSRLWIVCDSIYGAVSDSSIRIDSVHVTVLTRKITVNADNQFEDAPGEDPSAILFSKWFESNYSRLALIHPELREVIEYTKAVVIARWLVQNKQADVDPHWVNALLLRQKKPVRFAPALENQQTFQKDSLNSHTFTIKVTGGVQMDPVLALRPTASSALSPPSQKKVSTPKMTLHPMLTETMRTPRQLKSKGLDWELTLDGKALAAINAKGERTRYHSAGSAIINAETQNDIGQTALVTDKDNNQILQYSDQKHIIQATYSPNGKRLSLWQYPKVTQVPAGGAL